MIDWQPIEVKDGIKRKPKLVAVDVFDFLSMDLTNVSRASTKRKKRPEIATEAPTQAKRD